MKNITRHSGKLRIVGRMKNSKYGNPQFMLSCDGYQFRTQANSSIAFVIENYLNKEVIVTVGTFRKSLTLNTINLK